MVTTGCSRSQSGRCLGTWPNSPAIATKQAGGMTGTIFPFHKDLRSNDHQMKWRNYSKSGPGCVPATGLLRHTTHRPDTFILFGQIWARLSPQVNTFSRLNQNRCHPCQPNMSTSFSNTNSNQQKAVSENQCLLKGDRVAVPKLGKLNRALFWLLSRLILIYHLNSKHDDGSVQGRHAASLKRCRSSHT